MIVCPHQTRASPECPRINGLYSYNFLKLCIYVEIPFRSFVKIRNSFTGLIVPKLSIYPHYISIMSIFKSASTTQATTHTTHGNFIDNADIMVTWMARRPVWRHTCTSPFTKCACATLLHHGHHHQARLHRQRQCQHVVLLHRRLLGHAVQLQPHRHRDVQGHGA